MKTSAKIVKVNVPQPPIPVPDKVEEWVQLTITKEEAEIIQALAGHELDVINKKQGLGSISAVYYRLCDAGINRSPKYAKKVPTVSNRNKAGWEWQDVK